MCFYGYYCIYITIFIFYDVVNVIYVKIKGEREIEQNQKLYQKMVEICLCIKWSI